MEEFHHQENSNQCQSNGLNPQDISKILASQKSYVTAAVITFFLYWLFYIPGIIFNIMYINDAKKTQFVCGQSPSGLGCLYVMLIIGLIPFLIFAFVLLSMVGLSLIGGAATVIR